MEKYITDLVVPIQKYYEDDDTVCLAFCIGTTRVTRGMNEYRVMNGNLPTFRQFYFLCDKLWASTCLPVVQSCCGTKTKKERKTPKEQEQRHPQINTQARQEGSPLRTRATCTSSRVSNPLPHGK